MSLTFEGPAVCLVTRGETTKDNYHENAGQILDIVHLAVNHRITLVQIREKRLTARLLFELATAAASITQGSATKLVINDRADIAIAAGANGVHLTSHSLPTDVVRKMVPEHFIVGRSAHSVDEVLSARKAGADYVLFGPVFETPGKDGTQGLDRLREACVATRTFPVIAIGGIDDTNVRIALDAGAAGVAAIRALGNRESMEKLTALVNAI